MKILQKKINILFITACTLTIQFDLKSQIPEPYLYYDFDDESGTTNVIDSSGKDCLLYTSPSPRD